MAAKERKILSVVDAPEINLTEDDKAGDVLIKFYEALGWNSETEMLDPCKVRTTKTVYKRLYDLMTEKCSDNAGVGMVMVNSGPGTDDDVPEGKIFLLQGWVSPVEKSAGQGAL